MIWSTPINTTAAIAFCIAWVPDSTQAQLDEISEPPLAVELTLNGEKVIASPGKEFKIFVNGQEATVSASIAGHRELRLQHLRFQYPSYFKYEVHFSRSTKVPVRWDLDGKNVDITVFRVASSR